MTINVLKLPGDYKLQTTAGGTITFDTRNGGSVNTGTVNIYGDLRVYGTSTNIITTDITIQDNLLILNSGEIGPGVTVPAKNGLPASTAGIMVARGNSDSSTSGAWLIYDDSAVGSIYYSPDPVQGVWRFGNPASAIGRSVELTGVFLPSALNTLTFFSDVNLNGILSVKGYTRGVGNDYETRITDDDHIPNKAYVDSLLSASEFAKKLIVGKSFVEIKDNSITTSSPYYSAVNQITACLGTSSNVVMKLEDNAVLFKSLNLSGTRIRGNTGTNANISIEPDGSGLVVLNSGLRMQQTPAVPASAGYTGIYSTSTVGGGGTGLYYVNTTDTDELVSRKRAIVYGIIF